MGAGDAEVGEEGFVHLPLIVDILFRNLCVCSPEHTCKNGHTVALSVKDSKWKQPKWAPTDEQIGKM